jgi:hypothetical protein
MAGLRPGDDTSSVITVGVTHLRPHLSWRAAFSFLRALETRFNVPSGETMLTFAITGKYWPAGA